MSTIYSAYARAMEGNTIIHMRIPIYIYTYTYQRVPLYGTVPLVSCPEMHVDILPQCHSDIELITHFSDRISSMYGSTVMARYTRSKSLK